MANLVTDEAIINKIASYERSIVGIKESYDAFRNPDNLPQSFLPCVLHFPEMFDTEPKAHHNIWTTRLGIKSILFVAPRDSQGGKLKYLENAAMPFLTKWRQKFQEQAVINDLLGLGLQKAFLRSGFYGAGGNLLTVNMIPYIGAVFTFEFSETR